MSLWQERAEKAEAELARVKALCAEMRAAIQEEILDGPFIADRVRLRQAVSTDAGKVERVRGESDNWKALASNNLERVLKLTAELARAQTACAEMRAALVTVRNWDDNPKEPYTPEMIKAVRKALSADAGKDYVPLADVQPLIEALKDAWAFWEGMTNTFPDKEIKSALAHARAKGWV